MAHKTFISYKYSEARILRDKIIDSLGADARYYQGETSESPNISNMKTETIRKTLADMIYSTSVTIVIISPHMNDSEWISWEIEHSLRVEHKGDTASRANGIVGVIMKVNGGYDWFKSHHTAEDGCEYVTYKEEKVPAIIRINRDNQEPKEYWCEKCQIIDELDGNYIAYIEEEEFLKNPQKYIENAYEKAQSDKYNLTKKPFV